MYLLDCVDGELARLKKVESERGVFLDLLGAYFVDLTMIVGAGLGLAKLIGDPIFYATLVMALLHMGDELLRKSSVEK